MPHHFRRDGNRNERTKNVGIGDVIVENVQDGTVDDAALFGCQTQRDHQFAQPFGRMVHLIVGCGIPEALQHIILKERLQMREVLYCKA